MGNVRFGVPKRDVRFLKDTFGLTTFVETGTYEGKSALGMKDFFSNVVTIEKSDTMFKIASENLKATDIISLFGDTREHLSDICANNQNILFWLDAHWSGGMTYGEDDECPLLEEIKIILDAEVDNHVILVDDARLFLSAPPLPHDFRQWPSVAEIVRILPVKYDMLAFEDVLFIMKKEHMVAFKTYLQNLS